MVVSMKLHLDASIDKLDNLAMNVQLDKEKRMENTREKTEPDGAEVERVDAEIVSASMVAETQEYQYNADAFEARGATNVTQETLQKNMPKVRESKAR